MMRPGTGRSATRPETCRPWLSSLTSGWLSVPAVTDTAASMTSVAAWICTPVSQLSTSTSGSPTDGVGLPTEKFESQPRPRIRMSSSALAGSASGCSEVEVLIRQWIADQRVVGRIHVPPEGAEGRGNTSRLDIDPPILPGTNADIERVGLRPAQVFGAELGQKRDARPGLDRGRNIHAHSAQQRVVVVAVIEEAAVFGARSRIDWRWPGTAERRRDVPAEGHASVAKNDGVRGQHWAGAPEAPPSASVATSVTSERPRTCKTLTLADYSARSSADRQRALTTRMSSVPGTRCVKTGRDAVKSG